MEVLKLRKDGWDWVQKVRVGDFPGGTMVRSLPANVGDTGSLVWEDPTCREATKPVRHNY